MTDTTVKRIGFPCKWIDYPEQINGIHAADDCKKYNTSGTTVAWLNRQSKSVAEQKLWDLMKLNIESIRKLVEKVGTLDESLRMVRLGSDILPVYTQHDWSWFWRQNDVQSYAQKHFAEVGDIARSRNVRLSFHPGQYTVMASDNDDIVRRSIEEFEYHADIARWLGYGKKFQDLKINVHIAGRKGPAGIQAAIKKLSPEARNCLTIENDEMTWGIDSSLELAKDCALVLDIHHHFIKTGEYIDPNDSRVKKIIDSWRGVRPTLHFSVSREDLLGDHDKISLPNLETLLSEGYKKAKLRAHSDYFWNTAVNQWALSFLPQFDIMTESKAKNLASFALHKQAKELNLL